MPQATTASGTQSVLDRVMSRWKAKKESSSSNNNNNNNSQEEPEWVQDTKDPSRNVRNPKYVKPGEKKTKTSSDSPTDLYAGMFDAPTTDGTKQPPKFNLSPEKIKEAAGKIDFMSDMPDELKTALAAEGGLNIENISALVNHAGRSAYSRALEHGSAVTGHFIEARIGHESQGLDEKLRQRMARQQAGASYADNPVVKEHLEMISERIAQKHQDASPEEVAAMTHEYFTSMARVINPGAFESKGRTNANGNDDVEDVDFGGYLTGEKSLSQAKAPAGDSGHQQ